MFNSTSSTHNPNSSSSTNGNPTHTTITQGNPAASTPPPGIDPAQWALFQAFQAFQVLQQQQPTQQQQHSDQDELDNEQSDDDPYMYSAPTASFLTLYPALAKLSTTFEEPQKFHTFKPSTSEKRIHDIHQFPKIEDMEYTAPDLTRDYDLSETLRKQDKKWATVGTMVAHATRPIDSTLHQLLQESNTNDPDIQLAMESLHQTRFQLCLICNHITELCSEALYRDKKLIPPSNSERRTLVESSEFLERAKLTNQIRRATNQNRGRWARGHGYSNFNRFSNSNQNGSISHNSNSSNHAISNNNNSSNQSGNKPNSGSNTPFRSASSQHHARGAATK